MNLGVASSEFREVHGLVLMAIWLVDMAEKERLLSKQEASKIMSPDVRNISLTD